MRIQVCIARHLRHEILMSDSDGSRQAEIRRAPGRVLKPSGAGPLSWLPTPLIVTSSAGRRLGTFGLRRSTGTSSVSARWWSLARTGSGSPVGIESARAVDHPRLGLLYVMAAQCWMPGRIEAAVGYSDAAQTVIANGGEVPFGLEGGLGGVYLVIGQPERMVEWCRAQLARGRDTHALTRASLVLALWVAGAGEEARAAANGLIEAAEATHNPFALAYALNAYGGAFGDADPVRAMEALRRGLVIARDSGNRFVESHLATGLSQLEPEHRDPLAALDHITLAIGNFYDSGHVAYIRGPLATLAVFLDRLEPAATIAGFALDPLTGPTVPQLSSVIAHLRDVLGEATYDSLARQGETMSTAAMVTYAYDQIDQARAELNAVSE